MVQEVEMTSLRFDESLVNGHFNDILNSFRIYVEDIQPLIYKYRRAEKRIPFRNIKRNTSYVYSSVQGIYGWN